MHELKNQDRRILHKRTAVKTVVFYAIIACLWIYFSDTVLSLFISDPKLLTKAQTVKGLLYVLVTATLLYLYLVHCLQALRNREEELEKERERAQKHTRERLSQLNTLFDSMNAIVYVSDLDNYNLLYVNKFAADHFGEDWQDAKCYHYLQAGIDTPCDFCTNQQLINNGEAGEPVVWEFLNTKNNRWYNCFDKAIRWTDGRLARLEIAFDVTERKELEKLKDDLLSSMSHEMRTPLTAISGFTELLLNDSDLSTAHSRHVEIIFRETERLTDLVDRFLDIRRLKIDRSRVNYKNLSVVELLARAKEGCRDCTPDHNIMVECDDETQVFGNHKELIQVFRQLLENACLYSPRGGDITVQVIQSDNHVSISFSDQGIGIPSNELESIFKPFHRLDTGDSRSTTGVGLGLSSAREVVSLHSGKIEVKSTEGQGSTFTVHLPAVPTQKAADNIS
jgi:signal transduction histidine kinase